MQHLRCRGSEILKLLLLLGEAPFLQDPEGLYLWSVRRHGLLSSSRYKDIAGNVNKTCKAGVMWC